MSLEAWRTLDFSLSSKPGIVVVVNPEELLEAVEHYPKTTDVGASLIRFECCGIASSDDKKTTTVTNIGASMIRRGFGDIFDYGGTATLKDIL